MGTYAGGWGSSFKCFLPPATVDGLSRLDRVPAATWWGARNRVPAMPAAVDVQNSGALRLLRHPTALAKPTPAAMPRQG